VLPGTSPRQSARVYYPRGSGWGEWVKESGRWGWHDGEEPGQLRIDT